MDWGLIFESIKNAFDIVAKKFVDITSTWSEFQWMLFGVGLFLLIVSVIQAMRAKKIFSYKLATFGIKVSFTLIVLAFAWPYAIDLYNTAKEVFGNPVVAFGVVLVGGIFGYNIVKLLLMRRSKVE